MSSIAEQKLSRSLRTVLADSPNASDILCSEQFKGVLYALPWFLPEVLAEVYQEWKFGDIDDITPVMARKAADEEMEIFGLCCFVSDQTLTPLHLRLQVAVSDDEISWLECRLGERGQQGMVRMPYGSLTEAIKRLYRLDGSADVLNWVYQVTFGHQRS